MTYPLLRFAHLLGVITLGAGLVGVLVADTRARRAASVGVIAEACRYEMTFYYLLVFPGAVLVGVSGLLLTLHVGFGFFTQPWLTGMWALFLFEFVEGNTITHFHFRALLARAHEASVASRMTRELHDQLSRKVGAFTHFLDIPLFLVMVFLGATRPATWVPAIVGTGTALFVAGTLTAVATKASRCGGGAP